MTDLETGLRKALVEAGWGAPDAVASFTIGWLQRFGSLVCEDRGHDYCLPVDSTSNMWICFRCGEPGWMVPLEVDDECSTDR